MFQTTNQIWKPHVPVVLLQNTTTPEFGMNPHETLQVMFLCSHYCRLWETITFNGKTHYKWAIFSAYVSHYQRYIQ